MTSPAARFLIAAPDQPGLVAKLAGFFSELGLNIVDASNHTEHESDENRAGGAQFFMRLVVDLEKLSQPKAVDQLQALEVRPALERAFGRLADSVNARWSIRYSDIIPRVAILVTKDPACLYDLLLRQRSGELACEIPLILSNHAVLEPVASNFRIPFFTLPVTSETKREQEGQILELTRRHRIDVVVLARYMQVLTNDLLKELPAVINIHHGFLPAFQGAKPYHQAYARGVKLIGATAHYATADLDQGPIIEQDVVRVTHSMSVPELVQLGRDVERVVLARAVRAHLEHRVIVEGVRTIVF